ncbi:MAG: type II toxin-antitoxin system VapC family toxin [Treponema sp.]|nr:type II toxin-antitoxin system VapC family toxin [Treponema sp.]
MTEESTKPLPCFAVDASFMAAYLLNGYCDNELADCVKDVEYILTSNGQFYVPPLFWYEIENVLLCKTRKGGKVKTSLSKSDAMDILYDLQKLPICTDVQTDGEIRQRIFALAVEYGLSYYDASYLELSRRYGIALKTYDADLQRAIQTAA